MCLRGARTLGCSRGAANAFMVVGLLMDTAKVHMLEDVCCKSMILRSAKCKYVVSGIVDRRLIITLKVCMSNMYKSIASERWEFGSDQYLILACYYIDRIPQ